MINDGEIMTGSSLVDRCDEEVIVHSYGNVLLKRAFGVFSVGQFCQRKVKCNQVQRVTMSDFLFSHKKLISEVGVFLDLL